MVDSRGGWTDSDEQAGGLLSGDDGQAKSAAKAALPTWNVEQVASDSATGQAVQQHALPNQQMAAPHSEPATWRRSTVLLALFGFLALVGVAIGGYWLGTRDADNGGAALVSTDADDATDNADADPEAPAAAEDDTADDGENGDGETADGEGSAGTVTVDGEDVESDYVAPELAEGEETGFESDGVDDQGRPIPVLPDVLYPNAENPSALPFYSVDPVDAPAEGPYTVIEGGLFFVRGSVSSEAIRQELIKRNLQILTEEQLVVEYTIDPAAGWYFGDPIPVFLQDKLLFDVGSAEVNPAFLPLFQIGTNLLSLNEETVFTVVGHTDSEGDADLNLALSEARVNAVKEIYIELGANPDQIVAIGKGETEPRADNSTAEGRALNRRVEFIITSSDT